MKIRVEIDGSFWEASWTSTQEALNGLLLFSECAKEDGIDEAFAAVKEAFRELNDHHTRFSSN